MKLRCVDDYDKLVTYDMSGDFLASMDDFESEHLGEAEAEEEDGLAGLEPLTPRPAVNLNKDLLYDKFPTPMTEGEKTRLKLGIKVIAMP